MGRLTGHVFDIYHVEDQMYIWLATEDGRRVLLRDRFFPKIYARGPEHLLDKFTRRLENLRALAAPPRISEKILFYENQSVTVREFTIARPSLLRLIHRKLYAFTFKMDIFHCDLELPVFYALEKNIFPLARVAVEADDKGWPRFFPREDRWDNHYTLPRLSSLGLFFSQNARLPPGPDNRLVARYLSSASPAFGEEIDEREETLPSEPRKLIIRLNQILLRQDPDILLTAHGDQFIMPWLFDTARQLDLPLRLDRDPVAIRRSTRAGGKSFQTYGNIIFRAAAYPLFGRWHIDSSNSFLYKENELAGIYELARMSRLPVQKMARASTGQALTAMETEEAMKLNYLVPWQKSAPEVPKTAWKLLQVDKGGLQYQPDIRGGYAYENVAQIDYSQMYPTIMVRHNISPETVLCPCCDASTAPETVPEAQYPVCGRRRGVVSLALEPVLERRQWLKDRVSDPTTDKREKQRLDLCQGAIKWLLVTSFGYLGFRNAKFGRLESHESVTAFGREKILTAKEMAEARGYRLLHAITDCLFLKLPESTAKGETAAGGGDKLNELCRDISQATNITMNSDGVYSWVVFLSSTRDARLPVANRYFGRFQNGSLKIRGIAARRKDTPPFARAFQKEVLEMMRRRETIDQLKKIHEDVFQIYFAYLDKLRLGGPLEWSDFLIRRTLSREREAYSVANGSKVSADQLHQMGISVQPGEKVRYLVLENADGSRPPAPERFWVEEKGPPPPEERRQLNQEFYRRFLWRALREVWLPFAPPGFFDQPAPTRHHQLRLSLVP